MRRLAPFAAGAALLVTGMVPSRPAQADFELSAPDGRRIHLKDDGTWKYADSAPDGQTADKLDGEAVLQLERKTEADRGCRFDLLLVNNLPYEIRSLVPQFSAYRANGVLYETTFPKSSFAMLKPGERQRRELLFSGIACKDIARVQVSGGDRCMMGELNKFSDSKGKCLALVRVAESDLVRFDK